MGEIREDSELRDRVRVFKDRPDGGEALAEELEGYEGSGAWILAIPAGGVPVGAVLSEELELRLDLAIVRKIHIPWNPEAGFGAVSWDGEVLFNEPLFKRLNLSDEEVEQQVKEERRVLNERRELLRGEEPFPDLEGETVILADDGMASGFTMLAAVKSVNRRNPDEILIAVPTGSENSVQLVEGRVNELVCLNVRAGPTFAVAQAYEHWHDLADEEVVKILEGTPNFGPASSGT